MDEANTKSGGRHLAQYRGGFPAGLTWLTALEDDGAGLAVGVLRLPAGAEYAETAAGETAWLLMGGRVSVACGELRETFCRQSLFDQAPACLHVAAGSIVRLVCLSDVELTVYRCANRRPFLPRIRRDVPDEHRGRGLVDNVSYRLVRTILDRQRAAPEAELVLGEVVTLPGRWAGYPPHRHPQPEIYHYRFDRPQGFGFAQNGDAVFQVKSFDTVCFPGGVEHSQVAAPGYLMYFSWVIRHLPGQPYDHPEFSPDHAWILEACGRGRYPAGAVDAG